MAKESKDKDKALKQLRFNLQKVQAIMSKFANKNHKEVCYQPGERVYLKLRSHLQQLVARCINVKLSTHFYGPFMIVSKVGLVAYKL